MERLNSSSPRPTLAEPGAAPDVSARQPSPTASSGRRTMSSTVDLPARRTASSASNAGLTRRTLTDLPNELIGTIASHAKGRATVALAGTSKHLNAIVTPDLDSARLVDRAERARTVRDLESLYADTPDDPPRAGHPQGQPNAIARLPANQQAEPRAAVTAKLVSMARSLGETEADSLDDHNVFNDIAFLFDSLSNAEKLPVLAVLAAKSARIDPDPGGAGEVHYDIAMMIENAPLETQPTLWRALAHNVPDLPEDDAPAAFSYILDMMDSNNVSSTLRGDLLKLITPAITLFDPTEQLRACDSLVQAAAGLPRERQVDVQDVILTNLARGVVDMHADDIPAVLAYMLDMARWREPSQARQEDVLKQTFASAIIGFEPSLRADAAMNLTQAAEGLPANHREQVQAHIRAVMAEA